jgi:hypothetical protein
MNSRPRARIAGAALAAALAATTLALGGCSRAAGGGQKDERALAGTVFSGNGDDDPRVVLTALSDHVDLGVCAGKDPEPLTSSWTSSLVTVPGTLLGGDSGCGEHVTVSNTSGTTVTALVVGACDSCSGADIALSPALFVKLAPLGKVDGSIAVTWKYVS